MRNRHSGGQILELTEARRQNLEATFAHAPLRTGSVLAACCAEREGGYRLGPPGLPTPAEPDQDGVGRDCLPVPSAPAPLQRLNFPSRSSA